MDVSINLGVNVSANNKDEVDEKIDVSATEENEILTEAARAEEQKSQQPPKRGQKVNLILMRPYEIGIPVYWNTNILFTSVL